MTNGGRAPERLGGVRALGGHSAPKHGRSEARFGAGLGDANRPMFMVGRMSWTDTNWLAETHAWIGAQLPVTGEIEQPHVRPWSTVMRVPTADGPVWFKANTESLRYEAALVEVLAEERPDAVPALLAVDRERGWMLMADAGERLREIVGRERSLERWLDVLPLYAGIQIDLVPRAEELLQLGVPDMRLAALPAKFAAFLSRHEGQLGDVEQRVRARLPWIAEACEKLGSYGVPETIQHDDFHDGQVFVRDGRYQLMDWGDACIAHPFLTLSVTLEGGLAWGLDDVERSVDVTPFRNAYLEEFRRRGVSGDLDAACDLALRVGWICRVVNGEPEADAASSRARLRMFLEGDRRSSWIQ